MIFDRHKWTANFSIIQFTFLILDSKTNKLRAINAPNAIEKKATKSHDDPLENIQTILNLESYTIDKWVSIKDKDIRKLFLAIIFNSPSKCN